MLTFLAIVLYASIGLGVGLAAYDVPMQSNYRASVSMFLGAIWPVFVIAVVVGRLLKP